MLEAAILLQLVLGEYVEAAVIAVLLVFNAALGFFREGRAQATLEALKSRLALVASVKRDGIWNALPAVCRNPQTASGGDRSPRAHCRFGRDPRGKWRERVPGHNQLRFREDRLQCRYEAG
jgi:hypothetical protein